MFHLELMSFINDNIIRYCGQKRKIYSHNKHEKFKQYYNKRYRTYVYSCMILC